MKKLESKIDKEQKNQATAHMMSTIMRDMVFFIGGLILYDYFLYKGVIYLHEAVLLLMITGLYILVIVKMEKLQG